MSAAGDRAYVQTMCDHADDMLDRVRATMENQVAALREEWSGNAASHLAAVEAHRRRLQEDSLQWLKNRANGEPPHQDVAAADHRGASALSGIPVRHDGPQQQPIPSQHDDEIAEASRLKHMTMQQFALERAELIRSSGRGLF